MSLPRCEHCDNWCRLNPDASNGTCHVNPPVVDLSHHMWATGWPTTEAHEGCRRGFVPKLTADDFRMAVEHGLSLGQADA